MTVKVSDVADLIRDGHLTDVRFLSFDGAIRDEVREDIPDDEVIQRLRMALRKSSETIEFRVSIEIETRECTYNATAATQVSVENSVISEELIPEFAPRIGFNVVYPYLREVIQSSSARLRRENIVIPLVDPYTIQLVEDED